MKRVVVAIVLGVVTLWPFAHRLLVEAYDLNPWQFFGLAMYATPTPPVLAALFRPVPGGWVPIDERSLPPAVSAELHRFLAARHALGTLHRPEDLGAAALRAFPDLTRIGVIVQRMKLDRATGSMTSVKHGYTYDRAGK